MKIQISAVKVKDRLREDMGDIEALAKSISEWGLLHPIVVDDKRRLVAGARRLAACKQLGMRQIEARAFGELSDAERREIELEENLRRKDLTAFEKSKHTAALAEVAKEAAAEEAKVSDNMSKTSKGGRPPKGAASREAAAERTGLHEKDIERAEAHVEAAERYPILQAPDWSQRAAVKAAEKLDEIPAKERRKLLGMIDEVTAPAKEALKMIESFGRASPEVREKVLDMRSSSDPREQSLAVTYLAETAPEPDPRSVWFATVAREARKEAKRFKDDALNARIERFAEEAQKLSDLIQAEHNKRIGSLNGRS